MTVALFLIVHKVKIKSAKLVSLLANITKCGLGIYMVHYLVVGLGYGVADALAVPTAFRIPVTAVISFAVCWGLISLCYRYAPKCSRWIFG